MSIPPEWSWRLERFQPLKNNNIQFSKMGPLAPLRWEIDLCARELFRTKFNFEHFLFIAFFDAMHIFGGAEVQTESTSLFFYIIIFQRWESF